MVSSSNKETFEMVLSTKSNKNSVDYKSQTKPRQQRVVYFNVILSSYIFICGMYGFYLCFVSASMKTIVLNIFLAVAANLGWTAGAHRLWSHKSYKAKMPLQIILMVFSCISSQSTVERWVRDHRMHHKYTDTNADPHSAGRGFFYSHFGWILMENHREFEEKKRTVDISDIRSNPVLMFQSKYTYTLLALFCLVLPTLIPMYLWNEGFKNAIYVTVFRYCYSFNVALSLNSFGHSIGYKPYDKNILPSQSIPLSIFTLGEGNHNFHHVFPCDYRSDEWGFNNMNLTTLFIEFFEKVGWAYDLKTVSPKAVRAKALKSGDGSIYTSENLS